MSTYLRLTSSYKYYDILFESAIFFDKRKFISLKRPLHQVDLKRFVKQLASVS
jgi:hypothetical protein